MKARPAVQVTSQAKGKPSATPSWACRCEDCRRRRGVPFVVAHKPANKPAKEASPR